MTSAAKIKHSPDQVWQKYLSFDLTPVNQFSLCDGPQVIHQSTDIIHYHLIMASDIYAHMVLAGLPLRFEVSSKFQCMAKLHEVP